MNTTNGRRGASYRAKSPRTDYTDPDVLTALTGGTSPWLSFAEICELLGETRSTVDKWRARGIFPEGKRKPNGSLMFARPAIAEFVDGLEVAA